MFLVFWNEVLDIAIRFLLYEIHRDFESELEGRLGFFLFRKTGVIKKHFNITVNHVVQNGLVNSGLRLLLLVGKVLNIEESRTGEYAGVYHF